MTQKAEVQHPMMAAISRVRRERVRFLAAIHLRLCTRTLTVHHGSKWLTDNKSTEGARNFACHVFFSKHSVLIARNALKNHLRFRNEII